MLAHSRFLARDVARKLVLVKDAPDGGEESRQLAGELGVMPGGLCKRPQLLADEIVERALPAEASFDALRRAALLDPDLSDAP
jgi:hypothetical protein